MPTQSQLDAFECIEWASPYLTSPDWDVRERFRSSEPVVDIFNRDTIRMNNGVEHWLELYHKPHSPDAPISHTISLVKFGTGLTGFSGMVHGGALLTLIDEALAYVMVANEIANTNGSFGDLRNMEWKAALQRKRPLSELMKGWFVTAKLDIKFLKPVFCPGIIGIETQMIEKKDNKMTMKATMKDGKGTPLLLAEGVWVKIGGGAKL